MIERDKTKLHRLEILIVAPNDKLGGAEQILKMIANHYKSEYVHLMFLSSCSSKGWHDLEDNIKINYSTFRSEYLGAVWLLFSIIKLRKKRFNYVFSSHVFVNGLIGVLVRLGLLKCENFVARESTQIFRRFKGVKLFAYKLMYKFGYPVVDLLICQTEEMKHQLAKNLPALIKEIKTVVIGNPIDLKRNLSNIKSDKAECSEKYIVSAGRLIPEKGFDILIRAFSYLQLNGSLNMKLIILGEGPERNKLESMVVENNLSGKVHLPGFVKNVDNYFKHAELCVVSSLIEGFPNVLLQMMMQNGKVISTRCAGGIENIPGIITVEVANHLLLAEGMLQALNGNKAGNRKAFDDFLAKRSIENFIAEIDKQLM